MARCGLSVSTIVPHFLTISQTAAELMRFSVFLFKTAAGRHLGFCCGPKVTSGYIAGCPGLPAYQIWRRYRKKRLSYGHFTFSKWRPSAILDFVTGQKCRCATLRTVRIYHHAKFGNNISHGGWDIAIFRFSKWRPPPSWIWLDFIFRPPTKSTWRPEANFQILCRSDLYFWIYCDFSFRKFGLKRPIPAQKNVFLGDFAP